jgi:Kef-type K+ transport system membrane component KefB
VAISGVIVPFALGFALLLAFGHETNESVFLGAALVATSVGVTARVFGDLKMLRHPRAQIVLAAAVIDDVLGLLVLAVVAGLAAGKLDGVGFLVLLGEATFFLFFVTLVGSRLMRRHAPLFDRVRVSDGPFVVGVAVCLGLSALASKIGLAAIVGAFLAGMVFAETREHYTIEKRIEPVTHFLTPFFFVLTGMAVDPRFFTNTATLGVGAAVLAVAIVGKVAPCALAAKGLGLRGALTVGVGMVPRAEVGIIVAAIGLRSGVLGDDLYGVVVAMSVLTTLITPPILRIVAREESPKPAPVYETRP